MSALARATATPPGRTLVDRLAARGVLWPLLAARRGSPHGGGPARLAGRMLWTMGLNPALPGRLVTSRSAACIEGFPRSANSLAVYTFMRWNPGIRVAHHLHAAFQLRRASRLGVPCALIVRPPLEAVASVVMMTGGLVSEEACYRSYVRFHVDALPLLDRVTVCGFAEVVDDPSIVVRRLNDRFATAFAWEHVTVEARAWLTDRLGAMVRDRFGVLEGSAPVPSAEKDKRRLELQARLAEHPLLEEADAAYAPFAGTDSASGNRAAPV